MFNPGILGSVAQSAKLKQDLRAAQQPKIEDKEYLIQWPGSSLDGLRATLQSSIPGECIVLLANGRAVSVQPSCLVVVPVVKAAVREDGAFWDGMMPREIFDAVETKVSEGSSKEYIGELLKTVGLSWGDVDFGKYNNGDKLRKKLGIKASSVGQGKGKTLNFDKWLKQEGLFDEYQDAGPSDSKEIEDRWEDYIKGSNMGGRKFAATGGQGKGWDLVDIDGATENDEMPKVGDSVKLVFEDTDSGDGEGMWVTVTKDNGDKTFEGILDNEPFSISLNLGDAVSFGWPHIREVMSELRASKLNKVRPSTPPASKKNVLLFKANMDSLGFGFVVWFLGKDEIIKTLTAYAAKNDYNLESPGFKKLAGELFDEVIQNNDDLREISQDADEDFTAQVVELLAEAPPLINAVEESKADKERKEGIFSPSRKRPMVKAGDDTRPSVDLVGGDGNAFAVLGKCIRAAKKAGWSASKLKEFQTKAMSGDYDNLLATVMEYFDVDGGGDDMDASLKAASKTVDIDIMADSVDQLRRETKLTVMFDGDHSALITLKNDADRQKLADWMRGNGWGDPGDQDAFPEIFTSAALTAAPKTEKKAEKKEAKKADKKEDKKEEKAEKSPKTEPVKKVVPQGTPSSTGSGAKDEDMSKRALADSIILPGPPKLKQMQKGPDSIPIDTARTAPEATGVQKTLIAAIDRAEAALLENIEFAKAASQKEKESRVELEQGLSNFVSEMEKSHLVVVKDKARLVSVDLEKSLVTPNRPMSGPRKVKYEMAVSLYDSLALQAKEQGKVVKNMEKDFEEDFGGTYKVSPRVAMFPSSLRAKLQIASGLGDIIDALVDWAKGLFGIAQDASASLDSYLAETESADGGGA